MNKKIVSLSLLILVSSVIAEIPLRNNYNSKLRPFLYTAEVEWKKLRAKMATMSVGDQFIWYVRTGQSSNGVRGWQSLTSSNPSVVSVTHSTNSPTSSNVQYQQGGGAGNVNGNSIKQVYPIFTLTANAPGTTVLKGVFNNGGSTMRYTSFTVTIPQ